MEQVSAEPASNDWANFNGLFKQKGLGLHITNELIDGDIICYGHPGIAYGLVSGMYYTNYCNNSNQSFGIVYLINGANIDTISDNGPFYQIEEQVANLIYSLLTY